MIIFIFNANIDFAIFVRLVHVFMFKTCDKKRGCKIEMVCKRGKSVAIVGFIKMKVFVKIEVLKYTCNISTAKLFQI